MGISFSGFPKTPDRPKPFPPGLRSRLLSLPTLSKPECLHTCPQPRQRSEEEPRQAERAGDYVPWGRARPPCGPLREAGLAFARCRTTKRRAALAWDSDPGSAPRERRVRRTRDTRLCGESTKHARPDRRSERRPRPRTDGNREPPAAWRRPGSLPGGPAGLGGRAPLRATVPHVGLQKQPQELPF